MTKNTRYIVNTIHDAANIASDQIKSSTAGRVTVIILPMKFQQLNAAELKKQYHAPKKEPVEQKLDVPKSMPAKVHLPKQMPVVKQVDVAHNDRAQKLRQQYFKMLMERGAKYESNGINIGTAGMFAARDLNKVATDAAQKNPKDQMAKYFAELARTQFEKSSKIVPITKSAKLTQNTAALKNNIRTIPMPVNRAPQLITIARQNQRTAA